MQIQDHTPTEDEVRALSEFLSVEPSLARRALAKFPEPASERRSNRAAAAIFEDNLDNEEPVLTQARPNTPVQSSSHAIRPHPTLDNAVIDLAVDDNEDAELNRAIKESLDSGGSSQLVPSDRAPDPSWAMVKSNAPAQPSTQDDDMDRAIAESYKDFTPEESEDLGVAEDQARQGGRPVAIRPDSPHFAPAALTLQALFFVPQIRKVVSQLAVQNVIPGALNYLASHEYATRHLVHLFANMDLVHIAWVCSDDDSFKSMMAKEWKSMSDSPGRIACDFLHMLADTIESEGLEQGIPGSKNLLNFTHGKIDEEGQPVPPNTDPTNTTNIGVSVEVNVAITLGARDLVTALRRQLTQKHENRTVYEVIYEPSQVLTFSVGSRNTNDKTPDFRFPQSFYVDQFLRENYEIVCAQRAREKDAKITIAELTSRKQKMTKHNDRDVLKDLRGSLHYYEHVAQADGDTARETTIKNSLVRLQDIISKVEAEIASMDKQLEDLEQFVAGLFDIPELQKHKYELRAVFIHDGFFGRKNIYSYVQDKGVWWKVLDHIVTEVPEEVVLTDTTGVHMGGGPYLLIYSVTVPAEQMEEQLNWSEDIAAPIRMNNNIWLDHVANSKLQKEHETHGEAHSMQNVLEGNLSTNFTIA